MIAAAGPLAATALLTLSFSLAGASGPNPGWLLGWIALIPLLAAVRNRSLGSAILLGMLFGNLLNLALFHWLLAIPALRWYQFAALSLAVSTFVAIWSVIIARLRWSAAAAPFAAAAAWAALEYLRSHAGFLAVPWGTLAQTQVNATWLLQFAGMTGECGVSFLVALGNAAIYQRLVTRGSRCLVASFTLVVAVTVYGAVMSSTDLTTRSSKMTVAALQTFYPAFGMGAADPRRRVRDLRETVARGTPTGARLVVLPESALNGAREDVATLRELATAATRARTTVVIGVTSAAKFQRAVPEGARYERRVRNEAWLLAPAVEPRIYRKVARVPFAEYLPLEDWMEWPAWLVNRPVPVIAGPGPRTFEIDNGLRIGPMICWESALASHARSLARDGATVLVLLANDGWFARSGGGRLHGLTARMRAVETGRPLIMAANEGPSMIVDSRGRVLATQRNSARSTRWITASIAPRQSLTPYSRLGDVFAAVCTLAALLTVAHHNRPARQRRRRFHRGTDAGPLALLAHAQNAAPTGGPQIGTECEDRGRAHGRESRGYQDMGTFELRNSGRTASP